MQKAAAEGWYRKAVPDLELYNAVKGWFWANRNSRYGYFWDEGSKNHKYQLFHLHFRRH